jgi:hypothetical protein
VFSLILFDPFGPKKISFMIFSQIKKGKGFTTHQDLSASAAWNRLCYGDRTLHTACHASATSAVSQLSNFSFNQSWLTNTSCQWAKMTSVATMKTTAAIIYQLSMICVKKNGSSGLLQQ